MANLIKVSDEIDAHTHFSTSELVNPSFQLYNGLRWLPGLRNIWLSD
jgi:hypothetical protein